MARNKPLPRETTKRILKGSFYNFNSRNGKNTNEGNIKHVLSEFAVHDESKVGFLVLTLLAQGSVFIQYKKMKWILLGEILTFSCPDSIFFFHPPTKLRIYEKEENRISYRRRYQCPGSYMKRSTDNETFRNQTKNKIIKSKILGLGMMSEMIFIDATLLVQKGFTIEREKLKLFVCHTIEGRLWFNWFGR